MEPKQQPPYPLRMTPELRQKLEEEAEKNRRSLNAEIVDRLTMSAYGERPDMLVIKTLSLAMARAEQGAAMVRLQSQRDLLAAARVAQTLVKVLAEVKQRGLEFIADAEEISVSYRLALGFVDSAKSLSVERVLDSAKDRAEQLAEAERDMLAAVAALKADVAPIRTLSFKGPSGKKREITVSTKTDRKALKK
ncbi:MAG: Arc family DNA-binding protein [Pseudorhodoferax sp.]